MSKPAKPTVAATALEAEPPKHAQWCLALICFLAGAAIMVIEISAYRLLAPTFGNSAFTWTALIGVILIAFSAGGYLGGWLAEKKSDFALLGWLLAGASVLTMFVPLINHALAPSFERSGLIAGPLTISILLFLIPGVLLGAVSPASVRLYSLLSKDAHVGFAAGTISMLGSLGSFVGTLLSGFYLLSHYGVKSIFLGTGVVLLVLAGLAFVLARNPLKTQLPIWIASLLAGTMSLLTQETVAANVIYEHDSYYHRIQVLEQGIEPHNERYLHLDSTIEGGMRMRDSGIILNYQQFWQLPQVKPGFEMKRALFVGAGAFGMPERMSMQYPQAKIEVAEIDPNVIETGRKFFKLDQFPQVQAHAGDARRFLKQSTDAKYDFIFGDAYNGIRQIPVHLASKEFFQLVHDRLSPQGIFVMNVISAIQGPRAELLAGMMKTLQEVFPHLEMFAVGGGLEQPQNVILLASNDSWTSLFTEASYVPGSELDRLARAYVAPNRWPTGGVVFTDDLNPVDAIIARGLMLE
jgi:spermidine synthase